MNQFATKNGFTKLTSDDDIWKWAVDQFNGKNSGFPIYYSSSPLRSQAEAEGDGGQMGKVAFIRIRDLTGADLDANTTFEESWSRAVFELLNSQNSSAFYNLRLKAQEGLISRDSFITEWSHLEFVTTERIGHFWKEVWLPWCKKVDLNSDQQVWNEGWSLSYDEWFRKVGGLQVGQGTYADGIDLIFQYYLRKGTNKAVNLDGAGVRVQKATK